MNNLPERRNGEAAFFCVFFCLLVYLLLSPAALTITTGARVWFSGMGFAENLELIYGYIAQAGFLLLDAARESSLFGAPPVSVWNAKFTGEATLAVQISFFISAGLGFYGGIVFTEPPPAERFVSGRQVTRNPPDIQRDLIGEGEPDGVKLHPGVTISKSRERQHMLVFGQSGAGKTQILLPIMAQAVNRGDRTLIFDYKGDFTENTGERLQILAPWDLRSWAWDISYDVLNKMDARTFAAGLIQENEKDPFWSNGARSLLVAMLVKLQAEKGAGNWGWRDLALLIPAEFEDLQQIVLTYNVEGSAFVEQASKTTTSLRATLAAFMAPIFDMADAWDGHPINRRISIRRWLIDPPEHYPRGFLLGGNLAYETLMKSYVQGLLRVVMQVVGDPRFVTKDHRVWVFLDEFRQLGKIDPLLQLLEVSRGKGVRFVLAAQDQASLADTYSLDQTRAMLGTVGTIIFGRTIGPSAADYSEQLGDVEIDRYTVTISGNISGQGMSSGRSTSYQRDKRPAFRPDEFGSSLGQFKIRGKWYSRALVFTGGNTMGVLDFPRVIWPAQREPVVLADWLAPGWPHSSSSYLSQPAPLSTSGIDEEQESDEPAAGAGGAAPIDGQDNTPLPAVSLFVETKTLLAIDNRLPENTLDDSVDAAHSVNDLLSELDELINAASVAEAVIPGIGGIGHALEIADLFSTENHGVIPVPAHQALGDDDEDEKKRRRQKRRQQEIVEDLLRQAEHEQ